MAVLEAATTLVAEGGLAALTVEAVVQRSGVARSTIYRQWDSVEALAGDALRALVSAVAGADGPLPPPGDLAAELRALLAPLVAGGADGRARIGLLPALLAEADRDDAMPDLREEAVEALLGPVERVVARAVEDGRLRAQVDPREAAELVLGSLVVRIFLTGEPVDDDDLDRLAAILTALPPHP